MFSYRELNCKLDESFHHADSEDTEKSEELGAFELISDRRNSCSVEALI
jgi:hypothetical protein